LKVWRTLLELTAERQREWILRQLERRAWIPLRTLGTFGLPKSLSQLYAIERPFPTSGAEADLYLARNRSTGTLVVLKVYRRGLRPKLEVIQALKGCDAKHVVRIFDSGESEGHWFEVLEYGEYGSLREVVASKARDETLAGEVLNQVSAALKHIHSKNLIHRDLKPENILVRSQKPLDLALTDFGIASLTEATQHFTTTSRTVKYGAPEAAAGVVTASSDYWSLGLVLLELVTGKHPFDGLSDLVIFQHLLSSPIDLSAVEDARWHLLLRGLLTRGHQKRWGANRLTRGWRADLLPWSLKRANGRPSVPTSLQNANTGLLQSLL